MNEEEKEKKNEKMISIDGKLTEDVRIKEMIKKKFRKRNKFKYNNVRKR